MTITHHLDDATLIGFAAGAQGDALAAVVAGHLHHCGHCHARLKTMSAIGAAMMQDLEPVALGDDALESVLAKARQTDNVRGFPRHATRSRPADRPSLPVSVTERIGPLADVTWRWLAPGVRHVPIPIDSADDGDLRLLRIEPGTQLPEHGHGGTELTLVLEGSYVDAIGEFRCGDVADLDEDVEHQPIVNSDAPCICLVAFERPARFKSLAARLTQPFTGM